MGHDADDEADDARDDLSRATTELGEPDALFQVSPGRHRAKLVAAVGLIVFGVVANYLWWVHGPGRFGGFEVKLLVVPIIIGVGLVAHMWRNRGLSVLLYPTGVLRIQRGEVESFPWAEVGEVRLKGDGAGPFQLARGDDGRVTDCWLPVSAPTFQVWGAWLMVKRADGTEAKLSSALADYPELAERVQQGTFALLWPKAFADLKSGKAVEFGNLIAEPGGLRAGKLFLAWADMKEMTVANKNLTVKRKGGWLPWATREVSTLSNPHVLFALYAEMTDTPAATEDDEDEEAVADERFE
jgi:hypothetical protein